MSEFSELVVSQLPVFHLPLPRCYMFTVCSFFTHSGQKGLMFPNDQPIETGRLINEYIIVNVNTACILIVLWTLPYLPYPTIRRQLV